MQVGHCTYLVKFPRKYENSFQFVAAEENASEVSHRKWFLEKKKKKKKTYSGCNCQLHAKGCKV